MMIEDLKLKSGLDDTQAQKVAEIYQKQWKKLQLQ